MKSYSNSVADTQKVEDVEAKLIKSIGEKELQLAATINASVQQMKAQDSKTNVVLGIFIALQLAFDAAIVAKFFL